MGAYPNKMTTPTCTCPICPLVAANLQVCNLIVSVKSEKREGQCGYDLHSSTKIPGTLVYCITRMVHDLRMLSPPVVGECRSFNSKEWEGHITRMDETNYDFCFHTKHDDSVIEDPLPMD